MQNEHERENGPEEGEYHFSDEGVYETSLDEEEGKAHTVTEKSGLGARFASYRRLVVLGGIFAGVLLVVYLVIAPPTTPPPTEITEAVAPQAAPVPEPTAPAVKPAPPAAVAAATKPAAPVEKGPSVFKKVMTSMNEEKAKAEEMVKAHEAATSAPVLATPPLPPKVAAQVPSTPPVQEMMAPLMNMPAEMGPMPGSSMMLASAQPAPQPPAPGPDKVVVDRLAALEESNAKLISQLNAQYAHKLAEFETQDKALQEQIRALTAKVSGMEAQMGQLMQTLTKQASPPPSPPSSESRNTGNESTLMLPSSEATQAPKASYSVQAIIPGRAWLRTDAGETVTVAEGDLLKGLGRVTKIDPYDGTIQIDTGSKVIMLTYGNGDMA